MARRGEGELAADLAHELIDPAASGSRAVSELRRTFEVLEKLALELVVRGLSHEERAFLDDLRREVAKQVGAPRPMPEFLERIDREDEVVVWLKSHGFADGREAASTLAEAGLDVGWLKALARGLDEEARRDVLRWLVATLTVGGLLDDAEKGAVRILRLVAVAKERPRVDRFGSGPSDGRSRAVTLIGGPEVGGRR